MVLRVLAYPRTQETKTGFDMTQTEAAELLRLRRALTGVTYNDETVTAWYQALDGQDYEACRSALIAAAQTEKRITVAHVVEQLPRRQRTGNEQTHSRSCICAGRGWIEVEQHDARHTWFAWDRCPNGPRTGFVEID